MEQELVFVGSDVSPPKEVEANTLHILIIEESQELSEESNTPCPKTLKATSIVNISSSKKIDKSFENTGIVKDKNVKRFKCHECGATFTRRNDKKKHVNNKHLGIKSHKCKICDKSFAHKGDLTRHVDEVHGKIKTIHCEICSKSFARKSQYMKHQNEHKQELDKLGGQSLRSMILKNIIKNIMNFALENLNIKEVGSAIRFSFDIKLNEKIIGGCNISIGNSAKQITISDGEESNFHFQPNKGIYATGYEELPNVRNHTGVSCNFEQLTLPETNRNSEQDIAAFHISQPSDDDQASETNAVEEDTPVPINKDEENVTSFYVSVVQDSEMDSMSKPLYALQGNNVIDQSQVNSSQRLPSSQFIEPVFELTNSACKAGDFANNSYPYQNLQNKNKPVKRFQCGECGKSFTMKFDMKKHINTIHLKLKPYNCTDCDRSFAHKGDLTRHVNDIHKGIKTFKCTECGKSFARKSHLVRHLNDHKGLKSFQCNDCGKLMSSKSDLKTHQVIHSGTKNFKCEKCDKCFALRSYLRNHMLISHTDDRNFKCTECDKSYTNKASLSKHQRRVHKPGSKRVAATPNSASSGNKSVSSNSPISVTSGIKGVTSKNTSEKTVM